VVGVVVPVHDEEELLDRALAAIVATVEMAASRSAAVFRTVVVLDDCRDGSAEIVRRWRGEVASRTRTHELGILVMTEGRVGAARSAGCQAVLEEFAAVDRRRVWLATTDADSVVPRRWLTEQLRHRDRGADAWLGTVAIEVSVSGGDPTVQAWRRRYESERSPVHGASMGVSASAYLESGGFPSVATGEDRALESSLRATGAHVVHDHRVPVVTSARRQARAPHGVAHDLAQLEA
jgi:cellulose synthase/poly-beta-1,6-N-acetylglucosamine synthase-like glycosyltransferase